MPIKGEVFARKDLFWVMSVCMGKICLFFFPLGIFMSIYLQMEVQAVHVKP